MTTDVDDRTSEVAITVVRGDPATTSPHVLWCGTFPATRDQVAVTRHLARGALADHLRFDVELVVLLVSELATNVVRHSGSRLFTLTIARTTGGDLRVTVIDEGHGRSTPHLRPGEPDDIGGRGLRLVDQSAQRWGVTREHGGGLAVWFELPERTFREYTRSLMAERRITLRCLAKITAYHPGYLSRVLNGRRPPSQQLAGRVDDALGANGALVALVPAGSPQVHDTPAPGRRTAPGDA